MKEEIIELLEEALPIVNLDSDFLFSELDSLGVVSIMMVLSEKYGIQLDSRDATPKNFRNIDSLVAMVRNKLMQVCRIIYMILALPTAHYQKVTTVR